MLRCSGYKDRHSKDRQKIMGSNVSPNNASLADNYKAISFQYITDIIVLTCLPFQIKKIVYDIAGVGMC